MIVRCILWLPIIINNSAVNNNGYNLIVSAEHAKNYIERNVGYISYEMSLFLSGKLMQCNRSFIYGLLTTKHRFKFLIF